MKYYSVNFQLQRRQIETQIEAAAAAKKAAEATISSAEYAKKSVR
jgi:hypothetical protein